MTANRLLLAAIAALALAGAAHAQETDSDVASTGEQVFRRFASLLPGPKSGVRRCVQVRSIGGGRRGHAVRSRRRPSCFKTTMNSQEFMEEERKAITGQTDPK